MLEPRQKRGDDALIDARGTLHASAAAGSRIVSLVPSLTELICALGLASMLVGRTGFCVHPREAVRRIRKVGGTKSVDVERIRGLAPTHLIVNIDENEKPTVDELAQFVPHVIVTHPMGPRDNVGLYRLFGGIFGAVERAEALSNEFELAYDDLVRSCARLARQNVLYLIWRKPWMTVSRETYISRTLGLIGWDTTPAHSPSRYPEIELDSSLLTGVDHILLSSEPYRFRSRDVQAIQAMLPHASGTKVTLIDGEMTSWYGSRAICGLRYLKALRGGE